MYFIAAFPLQFCDLSGLVHAANPVAVPETVFDPDPDSECTHAAAQVHPAVLVRPMVFEAARLALIRLLASNVDVVMAHIVRLSVRVEIAPVR